MDDEEDSSASQRDDPVVKEIPIFLSKRLQENLHVFQYPLQPKFVKTECNVRRSFLRPQNQEVRLEVELNVTSPNFDVIKAEDIAHEVDGNREGGGKTEENDRMFENDMMDKVTLVSNRAVRDPAKFAIGCFNGKELHLTPLKGFLQLRPSFTHLDKSLKRKRDAATKDSSDDEAEAGPSAQQVTVRFGKTEEKKTLRLAEKSPAEPWTECNWHKNKSTLSEIQKHKLIAEVSDDIGQAVNITPAEYIRVLVPEDQEQACVKPSLPSHVMSLHSLRALPLLDQCRILLKDAKIIQFQQLSMLLAGGEAFTVEALLRCLPQVAVLVRGNWIVKSKVLYPANTFSAVSGVPADVMCRSRDYILYLFTKNQYVDRRKVSSVARIPTEELKEIFVGISRLRHNKGWELSLPTDGDFVAKHADVVQRQNALWEQQSKQLSEFFKDGGKDKPKQRRKSKSVCEDVAKGANKKDSPSSDTDSGTEKNKSPLAPVAKRKGVGVSMTNGEVGVKSEPT